jgi:hypothetical protein
MFFLFSWFNKFIWNFCFHFESPQVEESERLLKRLSIFHLENYTIDWFCWFDRSEQRNGRATGFPRRPPIIPVREQNGNNVDFCNGTKIHVTVDNSSRNRQTINEQITEEQT